MSGQESQGGAGICRRLALGLAAGMTLAVAISSTPAAAEPGRWAFEPGRDKYSPAALLDDTGAQYGYSTGSQNTSETVFLPRSGDLSDPSRISVPGNVFYMEPRNFTLTARMEF